MFRIIVVTFGVLVAMPLSAVGGNIPVVLYNNDGNVADVSSALDINVVSVDADTVQFSFDWNATQLEGLGYDPQNNYGGIRIDQIAVVDGIFVEPASNVTVTGSTFSFTQRVGDDIQGAGELFNHPLIENLVTFELQEDSDGGNVASTLDVLDSPLTINLDLKAGNTFTTVEEYVASGQLRVGLHVISNQGESQVYISGPPPAEGPLPHAPEPSSIILLSLGALGLIGYGYRRRRTLKSVAA